MNEEICEICETCKRGYKDGQKDVALETVELPRMTLRQWYTGLAMSKLIGMQPWSNKTPIAQLAIAYADAQIAELKRKGEP